MARIGKTGKVLLAMLLLAALLVVLYMLSVANHSPVRVNGNSDAADRSRRTDPTASPIESGTTSPALHEAPEKSDGDDFRSRVASLLKERVEVCGLSPTDAAYFFASDGRLGGGTDRTAAILAEAAGKLVQRDDIRERATGHYLNAYLSLLSDGTQQESESRQCQSAACREALAAAANASRRNAARPLGELARQTRDPVVYATAVHLCQKEQTGGCTGISYAGWAQLEPDNAAPWMMLSEQARLRGDLAARAEAFRRIGAAGRVDFRLPDMSPLLASDALSSVSAFAQVQLVMTMMGQQAATSIEHGMALGNICLRADSWDDARKSLCNNLTNMMVASGPSAIDLLLAKAVAKKLAWSEARIQALQDESDLIMGTWMMDAAGNNRFSCDQLAKDVQRGKASLAGGERAFAQEYLAKSGKTLHELAEESRRHLQSLR